MAERPPRLLLALVAAFAVAAIVGVVLFPRAGTARSAGVVALPTTGSPFGQGGAVADWYVASPATAAVATPTGLRLASTRDVLALVSRTLGLARDRCYVLRVEATQSAGATQVEVRDETLRHIRAQARLTAGGPVEVAFSTAAGARVAAAFEQRAGAAATLGAVEFVPVDAPRCAGAGG